MATLDKLLREVLDGDREGNIDALLKEMVAELKTLKRQNQVKQVAFSASLESDDETIIGPLEEHTTLIFKNVLTNIGHAFCQQTGVFTAPVKGAYHFQWHVGLQGNDHPTGVSLIKNSEYTYIAWDQPESAEYTSVSQSVTLILEAGDTVFLRLWEGTQVFDNHNHHTTFSGHLLHSM